MKMQQERMLGLRARRLWFSMVGVLLSVAMMGLGWWWLILKPVLDQRRPFVGTWRLVSPSPTFPARPGLVVEKDFRSDGTIIERVWDPQAGPVDFNQPSPARWHVSKGQFREVIHGHDFLHDLVGVGGRTYVLLDSPVTWEGPDRFRVESRSSEQRTMIWSRSESVTGLPRTNIPIGPE